jgi:hypothetical protein
MQGVQQDADSFVNRIRKQTTSAQETVYIKAYQFGDIRTFCQSDNAPFGKSKK